MARPHRWNALWTVTVVCSLAAARPLREETITVGASIGVVLSGGGVLVRDRAEPKHRAKSAAWCARHARVVGTDGRWRDVDHSRAYVVATTLDGDTATRWIAAAEARAAVHGWATTRHHRHPTRDVPASLLEEVGEAIYELLERDVVPAVAGVFGLDAKRVSMNDCFLVKYDADRPGLEAHADGSEYSFSLPLNGNFTGGGTFFGEGSAVVRPRVGEALVHPGHLRHGGAPVVDGVRYVLVGFLKYR